jgi:hypothetical protein
MQPSHLAKVVRRELAKLKSSGGREELIRKRCSEISTKKAEEAHLLLNPVEKSIDVLGCRQLDGFSHLYSICP